MANKALFSSTVGELAATCSAVNSMGAGAYAYSARHHLAQLVVTGTLNPTFYQSDEDQLAKVLTLTQGLDPEFIAKAAIYARRQGKMKDMPALLLAILSIKSPLLLRKVFAQVVNNGRMLRSFVQIMRSGVVGRKSLGSLPKALVADWLNVRDIKGLIDASIGQDPSLRDIVRMVHPTPVDKVREAFFAWLLDKPYDIEHIPAEILAYEAFKCDRQQPVPEVPFQMLAALDLTSAQWAEIARRSKWQMLRMNLNTFARHGVFEIEGMTEVIAEKLRDPQAIRLAHVMPYQLLAAYRSAANEVPLAVKEALQDAMELALANVETYAARVVVCPDVSGSMHSSVTGWRKGASSTVRCIDVAALIAAAIARANPGTDVLPFEQGVVNVALNPRDSVLTNAGKLAAIGGGGTNCSAPLAMLARNRAKVDLVILVSDNESWMDARRMGATETMRQWSAIKRWNPDAKLVCIDLQPNGTTQANEQKDVLNVGGFSDEVFTIIGQYMEGKLGPAHWLERIEQVEL